MTSKYIPTITSILLSLLSLQALSDTLRVGFAAGKPPFVIKENNSGMEIDIVSRALALSGHSTAIKFVSKVELYLGFTKLNLDASASVREDAYPTKLYYSKPYIAYQNVAISKRKHNFKIESFADLKGLRVGSWKLSRGEFDSHFKHIVDHLGSTQYAEYADQIEQNIAFWNDIIDVILVDRAIFSWNRKALSARLDTSEKIAVHAIFPQTTTFKVSFKNKAYRDDFNSGLEQLHSSGEYQQIIKRYTPSP